MSKLKITKTLKFTFLFLYICFLFTGCDKGAYTMKADQYGIKFRNLPRILGGGVSTSVLPPGELTIVLPWESVYTFTTSVQEVSWGPGKKNGDYVYTRSKDGNEVALSMTVLYQISSNPAQLVKLIQNVGIDDKSVESVVISVARADIRNYMSELKTAEFIDPIASAKAVDKVKEEMQKRLKKYSIEIVRVNLEQSRFERSLPDGTKDDTYQEKRDEIQTLYQETSREISRLETIEADKRAKYNQVQGEVNRIMAEASGFKEQANLRGDNYLKAKINEAQGILEKGKAEVEGVTAQINAVAGAGGRALLRLDVARILQNNNSKFVVMSDSSHSNGVNVNKTDVNDFLKQVGIVESLMQEPVKKNSINNKNKSELNSTYEDKLNTGVNDERNKSHIEGISEGDKKTNKVTYEKKMRLINNLRKQL